MPYTFAELLELINTQQYQQVSLHIEKDHATEESTHNYWLNDEQVKLLTETLNKYQLIQELILPEHFLTDVSTLYISTLMYLKKLDLSGNSITIKGAANVASIPLESLNLDQCNINLSEIDDEAKLAEEQFINLILKNPNLKVLKLYNTSFGMNLLNIFSKKTTLESLSLSHLTEIKLEDNTSLKELEISLSTITNEDLKMLNYLHNIEKLTFYHCDIIGNIESLQQVNVVIIGNETYNNENLSEDWS